MDLLGAFSFGKVIKIFLPGFLIFIGFTIMLDAILSFWMDITIFRNFAKDNAALLTALSLPLILICGLLSNTILFLYLFRKLIREPYKRRNPDLFKLEDLICELVLDHYLSNMKGTRKLSSVRKIIMENIEIDSFLLPSYSLDKRIFLEESFWYFMDFQLNLILACPFLFLSIVFWSLVNFSSLQIPQRNFSFHRKKIMSLHLAVLLNLIEDKSISTKKNPG